MDFASFFFFFWIFGCFKCERVEWRGNGWRGIRHFVIISLATSPHFLVSALPLFFHFLLLLDGFGNCPKKMIECIGAWTTMVLNVYHLAKIIPYLCKYLTFLIPENISYHTFYFILLSIEFFFFPIINSNLILYYTF